MIETYYRILKHDPEGKLVKDSGLVPSHSYVIQFLELIRAIFDGADAGGVRATDVDGAENFIYVASSAMRFAGQVDASAGIDASGIVVGTNAGSSAEDNEDYALDTKIAHGAGAGQLNYQATIVGGAHVDAPNVDVHISRAFLNQSGNTITVKEIGLICSFPIPPTEYHLLLRDVVSDEDVLNDHTLTVIYTLRTTV